MTTSSIFRSMNDLLVEIRKCQVCLPHLEKGVNPVLSADKNCKIVIIGQAPGLKVHNSGKPWKDVSGNNLRKWMGINEIDFYDSNKIAIIPMGFCYPGKGKSGDLPPRPECAPLWHEELLSRMSSVQLTLLIGQYAQRYYLKERAMKNLTETVKFYTNYLPEYLPLPHPSPRNRIWIKRNPWYEKDVIPVLQEKVRHLINS